MSLLKKREMASENLSETPTIIPQFTRLSESPSEPQNVRMGTDFVFCLSYRIGRTSLLPT